MTFHLSKMKKESVKYSRRLSIKEMLDIQFNMY